MTKEPTVSRFAKYMAGAKERQRLLVEALGAVLIVCAVCMVSFVAGILVTGVALVLLANFYMGAPNAGSDDSDAENPPERR